jgi:putative DNA primase/helicase
LAFMEEFPELGHLNVKMLKMLLGTDEMSARYVHKDTVFWKATHTPFVTSNYLPRVDESDDGTWRRLVMLNFPYRYRKETKQAKGFDRPGEPELRERLRRGDGQEAVLAWLVEGAKQWYRRGMLTDPGSVRETTAQWRGTTDQILRYLEERMIFDPESYVMSTDLHQDLNHWLQANGHQPWGVHTFTGRFSEHHQVSDHGVVKVDRVRSSRDGLSRPRGAAGRPPGQFAAWVGLRYRNYLDEETTDELGK